MAVPREAWRMSEEGEWGADWGGETFMERLDGWVRLAKQRWGSGLFR